LSMANLDETMASLAKRLLKRPLTEQERSEILDIGSILGMRDIQEYLYLFLVFRLSEDRLGAKMDELCTVNKKLEEDFRDALNHVLRDVSRGIGREMGEEVGYRMKKILSETDDFYTMRGCVIFVCFTGIIAALAYWMGAANVLRFDESSGPVSFILKMPAGWWMIFSCLVFAGFWTYEHWEQVLYAPALNKILLLLAFLTLIAALLLL